MIPLKITPDHGEAVELVADSRDIIEWEIRKQGRHLGMLQATPRMTDLSELAWLNRRRVAGWSGDLSDFRRTVRVEPGAQNVGTDDDDGEADSLLDPTQTAP